MARMFHHGCRLPPGWSFEDAEAVRTHLRVRYRHTDGGGVTLVLEHPRAASRSGAAATQCFSIRVAEPRSERDCADLLAAVCASLAAHESEWRWCAPAADPLDVELCALLAGVKPSLRISVPAGVPDQSAARYRSAGVAVFELDRTVTMHGEEVAVLYAARDLPAAAELRDRESDFFELQARNASPAEQRHYNSRIGELLGYPRCCVESFCGRARPVEGIADVFRAAREAWVPLPYARLNDTLFPVRRSLISFEPCAYDCEAAGRLADRIAEALDEVDSGARRALDAVLARAVLVHPSGLRAWIEIDAGTVAKISSATAVPGVADGVADASAVDLARKFVGCAIEANGLVRPSSGRAAVALDFAAGRR